MTQITKEELLKIARISNLELKDEEIPTLSAQIQAVLTYAERVQDIASKTEVTLVPKNSNIFRPDTVVKTDPEPILAQAPQREQNYFVVPVILEN